MKHLWITSQRIPISNRYSDQNRLMHHLASMKRYNKVFLLCREESTGRNRAAKRLFLYSPPKCVFLVSHFNHCSSQSLSFNLLEYFCVPPLVVRNKVYNARRTGPSESNQRRACKMRHPTSRPEQRKHIH